MIDKKQMVELEENELIEIYNLIKKGYKENSGLNIIDLNIVKTILSNHGYDIDENLNLIKSNNLKKCYCYNHYKVFVDGHFVCSNCGRRIY